ncbi:MAG: hypothetical protein ACYC96_06445 [Fimbriimonadaceae bacterium]
MITHIILSLLVQGSSRPNAGSVQDLLVVESGFLSASVVSARALMSTGELTTSLRTEGYALVRTDDLTILFSQTLWQDDTMKRVLANYDLVSKAIRPDGSLDLSKDSDLIEIAQSVANGVGLSVSPDTPAKANVQRTYDCQVGGRTISLKCDSMPYAATRALAGQPLPPLGENSGRKPRARPALYFAPHDSCSFYAYGPLGHERDRQRKAYKTAWTHLCAHFNQFRERQKPLATALNNKICGFNVGDYYGMSTSMLPASVQAALQSQIASQFGNLGFGSREDAVAWLHQATLTGSSGNAYVMFPGSGSNSIFGVGIP